jgi:ribonuclease HI
MKTIYADGTPKGLAAISKDDSVTFQPIKATTNNEAEYQAILQALKLVDSYELTEIVSDSQLVVRQLTKEYGCHEPRLQQMKKDIRDVITERGLNVRYRWIPREDNPAGMALEKEIKKDDNSER